MMDLVSIPFVAGLLPWLRRRLTRAPSPRPVSIPFVAGLLPWHAIRAAAAPVTPERLNPLRSGAAALADDARGEVTRAA